MIIIYVEINVTNLIVYYIISRENYTVHKLQLLIFIY